MRGVGGVAEAVRVAERVLEGDVVVRQGGADLHQRRQAEEAIADAVRGHQDAVQVGVLGDPLQLGDAADVGRIGADDVDGVGLDQLLEVLAQVDLLAGMDRRRGAAGQVAVDIGVDVGGIVAGEQVLQPHHVQRLQRLREADGVGHHPAGAAVERQPDLIAHHLLHRLDTGDHVLQPLLGQQPAVERAMVAARCGRVRRSRSSGISRFIGLWKPTPCLMIVKPSWAAIICRMFSA